MSFLVHCSRTTPVVLQPFAPCVRLFVCICRWAASMAAIFLECGVVTQQELDAALGKEAGPPEVLCASTTSKTAMTSTCTRAHCTPHSSLPLHQPAKASTFCQPVLPSIEGRMLQASLRRPADLKPATMCGCFPRPLACASANRTCARLASSSLHLRLLPSFLSRTSCL